MEIRKITKKVLVEVEEERKFTQIDFTDKEAYFLSHFYCSLSSFGCDIDEKELKDFSFSLRSKL